MVGRWGLLASLSSKCTEGRGPSGQSVGPKALIANVMAIVDVWERYVGGRVSFVVRWLDVQQSDRLEIFDARHGGVGGDDGCGLAGAGGKSGLGAGLKLQRGTGI